jgi:hypothetical protein
MGFEVCAHKLFKAALPDDGLEAWEVFFKGGEEAKPILSVVYLKSLEGGEAIVRLDEGVSLGGD